MCGHRCVVVEKEKKQTQKRRSPRRNSFGFILSIDYASAAREEY